jgi:hypothetical protein
MAARDIRGAGLHSGFGVLLRVLSIRSGDPNLNTALAACGGSGVHAGIP